jgi:8-oxoguanine deaminase
MATILIKDLSYIAAFDDVSGNASACLRDASILLDGPAIAAIGRDLPAGRQPDLVIDGAGKLALPGFINTHHHFFQQLTRAVPAVHTASILDWLRYLYPIWAGIDEEAVFCATQLAVAQLLLTGCTTTSDMAYFFPHGRGQLFDVEVEAAAALGIRFQPCRAALPAMEADLYQDLMRQGVPAGRLIESRDRIMSECERVIRKYDRPGRYSMCRVSIGQTDKTYHEPSFMREMADLARRHGVMLHTHLHPRRDEIVLCRNLYRSEPVDFLEETGWLGPHVWLAHATAFTPAYVERIARSGTGISHSPSSNMRLGYGVAPIPALAAAGAKISVGVDGGASNDTGDFLGELRQTLLVHRIQGLHPEPFGGPGATTPEQILRFGTRGGATVLGRDDIGSLAPGQAADVVLYDLQRLGYAGALHDPLAALILCGESHLVDTTIVNGEVLVRDGRLLRIDETQIAARANRAARKLMAQSQEATKA